MKQITVGGIPMQSPILLGAGVCKSPFALEAYQREDLPLGAALSGSYTYKPRNANTPEPLFAPIEKLRCWLNSYGMPNEGFITVIEQLHSMKFVHPHVVSIAGFSLADLVEGIIKFSDPALRHAVAGIEVNGGCPNTHTAPVSYDLVSLDATLEACETAWLNLAPEVRLPIWFKLSPYLFEADKILLAEHGIDVQFVPVVTEKFVDEVADCIQQYDGFIKAVVSCNTIPNCRYFENGIPITGPNDGKAGLSGELLWPIALRQVRMLRERLPLSIDLIHSGGILSGDRLAVTLLNGASAVQVTSLACEGGPRAIADLLQSEALQQHLLSTMEEKV